MAVFCEHGNEHSNSIKCGKFLAEEILASEEELWSVVLAVRTANERVSSSSNTSPLQTMQVLSTARHRLLWYSARLCAVSPLSRKDCVLDYSRTAFLHILSNNYSLNILTIDVV